MKCANGTARAVRLLAIARNHQRRASVTFDDASGSDADHAAVPAFAVDHDAERLAQRRLLFEMCSDGLQNAALFLLPVAVELIEPVGQSHEPGLDLSR